MTLHEFAKKSFTAAIGVEIGGVDEVAARVAESLIDFAGFVLRRAPAPVFAEGHGAERGFRNSKTAVSQKPISHGDPFLDSRKSSATPEVALRRLIIAWSVNFRERMGYSLPAGQEAAKSMVDLTPFLRGAVDNAV